MLADHLLTSQQCEKNVGTTQKSLLPHDVRSVIGNAPEALLMASYRGLLGDLYQIPQGSGSLAYSVLTTPSVFMELQDRLKWKYVNYLWDDPDRPPVNLHTPAAGQASRGATR